MERVSKRALAVGSAAVVLGVVAGGFAWFGSSADEREEPTPAATVPAEVKLPPLTGEPWRVLEADIGGAELGVWSPIGAETPRPIVVVLDAARGGDPAALGAQTFERLGRDVFVMTWGGAAEGARGALRHGLGLFKERFGVHVARGGVLLVAGPAYSAPAAALLREDPTFFSRALLVDFDPAEWSSTLSVVFGQRGGQRLLFVVSEPSREAGTLHAATGARRSGAQTRVVGSSELARLPAPQAVLVELAWVLEGDARFPAPRPVEGAAVDAVAPDPSATAPSTSAPVPPAGPPGAPPSGASPSALPAPRD